MEDKSLHGLPLVTYYIWLDREGRTYLRDYPPPPGMVFDPHRQKLECAASFEAPTVVAAVRHYDQYTAHLENAYLVRSFWIATPRQLHTRISSAPPETPSVRWSAGSVA